LRAADSDRIKGTLRLGLRPPLMRPKPHIGNSKEAVFQTWDTKLRALAANVPSLVIGVIVILLSTVGLQNILMANE
jgi:hypothetical protein